MPLEILERIRKPAVAVLWRALADAGVPIAIGSDWPVGPIDPAATFRAARDRGRGTLTAEEVSRAYRGRPAGERVAIGDPADLVALAESGEGFSVRATIVGGAVTFDAAASAV